MKPLWVYLSVNDNSETIKWPNLLLINKDDLLAHIQHSAKLRIAREKITAMYHTPIEIVSDFIMQLWKHAVGDDDTPGYT